MPLHHFRLIGSLLLLAVSSAFAQTDCQNFPSSTLVPFTSIFYTTNPISSGDRLVVGQTTLDRYAQIRALPRPAVPNQQYCAAIEIAPGVLAKAYVPTEAEVSGNYSSFAGLLIDPLTTFPFAGGYIPAARIPLTFAWRVATLLQQPPPTASSALHFVPVAPCRLIDTRLANSSFSSARLAAQSVRDFLPSTAGCGIPSSAKAYALNVTVVPTGRLGYVTVFPADTPQPLVSTLNSYDGRVKANAAIVPAGTGGAITVFATDETELILDINGYFVSDTGALSFYPVAPCRVVDTRSSPGNSALQAQEERAIAMRSSPCALPPEAQAYTLNVTAIPKGPLQYLTTWPTGTARPTVSTLSAPTGTITANAAILSAGQAGDISVYASDATDLIVDVNGYFAPPATGGLSFYALPPCRIYDSRRLRTLTPPTGIFNISVQSTTCGVASNAQSVVSNATVVPSGSLLYLSLWADGGAPQPNTSVLNAIDGAVSSNLAVIPTNNGSINAFISDPSYLILDVTGFFAP